MRILLSSFILFLALAHSSFGQISTNWQNFSEDKNEIELVIENVSYSFTLSKNSCLSEKLLEENPQISSYDLTNTSNYFKGKLTLDGENRYVSILRHGKLYTQKWIEGEAVNSSPSPVQACGTKDKVNFFGQNHIPQKSNSNVISSPENLSHGDDLTTYRLAIIGTGEYSAENGGTEASALASSVATVDALNLIFEADLSVTLILSESRFYTDLNSDPFEPSGDSRTNQAAEAMAMNFNNADYDIGHVFHHLEFGDVWASGGIAGLGVVCDNSTFFSTSGDNDGLTGPNKGAAWSGSFDNFSTSWVQLSAHEFGHQFDALHTFNGNGNANCNGGISSTTAYEIGSGTTIMSYSGLCSSAQNVPSNGEDDSYFHSTSIDRMRAYIESSGSSCAQSSSNANSIPTASTSYLSPPIIPIGTPFELEGQGEDLDGDALIYAWEQIDEDGSGTPTQGFIGASAANSQSAPLFKSIPPSDSDIRIFPSLTNILEGNNQNLTFEALPEVSRDMNFSFIVRDSNGGVASSGLTVVSDDSAGPFIITSQNTTIVWEANGTNTASITWNVANTTNSAINCQTVNIWLSTDNGANFTTQLASNTANDGSHTFLIPNVNSNTVRIKVKASNNVFFDINNDLITINSDCEANGSSFAPAESVQANQGDVSLDLDLSPIYGQLITNFSGQLTSSDAATSLAAENGGSCINFNLNTTVADQFEFQVTQSGNYTFSKSSGGFGLMVHLYEGEFIPSSPCTNWLVGSFDTSTSLIGNQIESFLSAGIDYTIVIAGFNGSIPSLPQTYTYSYSGPGDCISGEVAPAGFEYGFIITDTSTNDIVEISLNPDLTSYSGGIYTVLGFSYPLNSDLSGYLNNPLSILENDIINFTTCGSFSSNTIDVEIISAECAGDLNGDSSITAGDLTLFLAEFGCESNCSADLTGDGKVTASDLTIFLSLFGNSCP